METLSIGRPATAPEEDYAMEICGKWLAFTISLHGDEVRLAVSLMDSVTPPQTLLRTRDDASGWQLVIRLVGALEKAETKSLERPIEVGPIGPDGFRIA